MSDPKNGFRMTRDKAPPLADYNVQFNGSSVGSITFYEGSNEWVFVAGWNGCSWNDDTLTGIKKKARAALRQWFKSMKH